ncbi:helix-turn-helix transcriptional regulator [Acidobacteria bacterium AH-259-O06]|nr:helix-turn-helix transcriptional regulator [Acidobacteria bacterium AH-259-O06]
MQKIRIELGRRVRQLRKANGWSQEELGERADLHPTYVGGIERGERNVSLENLERLARAFGLSLSQLFDFARGKPYKADTLRAKIVGLLARRDESDLECVLEVLGALDRWKERS